MVINDINSLSDEIFNVLKDYIENHNKDNNYSAIVREKVIKTDLPLIVFDNRSNVEAYSTRDMYGMERTRDLSFEINIYANDDLKNQISSVKICKHLENLVTQVMQGMYRMQGGTDGKLHNINNSKTSQYILHFSCEWFMNRNIIYK